MKMGGLNLVTAGRKKLGIQVERAPFLRFGSNATGEGEDQRPFSSKNQS